MGWKGIESYINVLYRKMIKGRITPSQYKRYTMQLVLWDMNGEDSSPDFNDWEVEENEY
jgi:hypothetical protein